MAKCLRSLPGHSGHHSRYIILPCAKHFSLCAMLCAEQAWVHMRRPCNPEARLLERTQAKLCGMQLQIVHACADAVRAAETARAARQRSDKEAEAKAAAEAAAAAAAAKVQMHMHFGSHLHMCSSLMHSMEHSEVL